MEVSKHAAKRWVERIDRTAMEADAVAAVADAVIRAELLYRKPEEDGQIVEFYLLDDVVLVAKNNTVLTVFRAEYGFNAEIDRQVCTQLKLALAGAREELRRAREEAEQHATAAQDQLDRINAERQQLEARLQMLRARENKLLEEQTELDRRVDELEHLVESYAMKIVYSVLYRSEWTSGKVKQLG